MFWKIQRKMSVVPRLSLLPPPNLATESSPISGKGVFFSRSNLSPVTILHPSCFCWDLAHALRSIAIPLMYSSSLDFPHQPTSQFLHLLKRISISKLPSFQYLTSPCFDLSLESFLTQSFLLAISVCWASWIWCLLYHSAEIAVPLISDVPLIAKLMFSFRSSYYWPLSSSEFLWLL